MIEAVTIDQDHFRVPTLRTDARGVVIGDRAVMRFSILPQVISFFQALTEEQSLDHMAQTLRLLKVRSRTTGMELLVDIPAQGSYVLDRAAKIARLMRGEAFVGSWPHFVPYRDRSAPYGYDAQRLESWSNGPVFYGKHGAQKLEIAGEISFEALVVDLSLERINMPETKRCTLRVREGLRGSLQSFLWRRGIKAKIAQVVAEAGGQFAREERLYLVQLDETPHRLYSLFQNLPGVEVYHNFGRNLFVERGFRHPFAIENCRRFFSSDKIYLFSGSRDAVDRLDGDALTYVDIADLNAQRFRMAVADQVAKTNDLMGQPDAVYHGVNLGQSIEYKVNIVNVPGGGSEHITGVLIREPQEIAWLKRLVYSLPQTALEQYKAAFTDHGVLVTHPDGVELIPLGLPLKQVFPNVFLPAGMRFAPPISYEHLARALNMTRGHVYVLPYGIDQPLEIADAIVQPLVRYLLADVDIARATDLSPATYADGEAGIPMRSADASLFSLWMQNIFKPSVTDSKAKGALPAQAGPQDGGEGQG